MNLYAILRRSDGAFSATRGFPIDNWIGSDLRLDPAPCWNRTSDMIAQKGTQRTAEAPRVFVLCIVS